MLQKLPVAEDEVNVVELPTQNELLPVTVGVVGKAVDETATTFDVSEVQVPDATRTE